MLRPTAAVLAQIPLFTRVSAADRERLIPLSEVREYDRGDMVFHEGDASDFFFVVLTGRIKVYKHGPDGHDIILEMFGPGGPLGAVATFESRPYRRPHRPWSHRAACSSRVRRFSSCSSGTRRWCAACSAVSRCGWCSSRRAWPS